MGHQCKCSFAIHFVVIWGLTWSNASSCSSSFSIRALVSPLEPQVVVPPSHFHSHRCQKHYSSWGTQGGPWGPHSHQWTHSHEQDQVGQAAPHGKNSRSASPVGAGRLPPFLRKLCCWWTLDPASRETPPHPTQSLISGWLYAFYPQKLTLKVI